MPLDDSTPKLDPREGEGGAPRPHVWGWGLTAAFAYSLVLLACFAWHVWDQRDHVLELARADARTAWAKDVDYRRWIASHGGVYVPATDKTPPNPYLKVPDRDIAMPSGRMLTLVNPAYMTRQVHELAAERAGVIGHITSLKPLRPENAPDEWEADALRAFERGQTEVSGLMEFNHAPHMRVMRPLFVEQSCLKCHSSQGYKVGDVRGGISAAVPLAPLLAFSQVEVRKLRMGYALVWLLGLAAIVVSAEAIRRRNQERERPRKNWSRHATRRRRRCGRKGLFSPT